jgi:hypothetical protein
MAKAKRGRPRKAGQRNKSGRLICNDKGNVVVQRRAAIFAIFQGGKADQQIHDSIGRAWAVGLLDGYEVDGAAIRDAGRTYFELYWGASGYPTTTGTANYDGEERRGRGGSGEWTTIGGTKVPTDARGDRFKAIDRALLDAGRAAYDAAQDLCLGLFPDENPLWLDRLINERRVKRGQAVAGMLPVRGDLEKMRLAVSALLAVAAGSKRRRAA